MATTEYLQYWVKISKDRATNLVVAEVPALGTADDGVDQQDALSNIQKMVEFHLDCLTEEGQPLPIEKRKREGLYLHVRRPARAA